MTVRSSSPFQIIASHLRPSYALERVPQIYDKLGSTLQEQAQTLASLILPGNDYQKERQDRQEIFEYIVLFLHRSTFQAPLNSFIGKGQNLAKRPYLAPTGFRTTNPDGEELPDFFYFAEQYRWDTYFHNVLLKLIGFSDVATGQLLNLVDVFNQYQRIPNALTTEFLSHPQPPMEALSAHQLCASDQKKPSWFSPLMHTVEAELFTEWWDFKSGKVYPRQTQEFVSQFGPYLSRYVSIHMHPLLVGCQDGKDHSWINAYYGEYYLPVQLNCLLLKNVELLTNFYTTDQPDAEKAQFYQTAQEEMRSRMQELFWVESGRWRGFRNYSIGTSEIPAGPILYGDLSAEIFPLLVGLATPEQAHITLENLQRFYEGDIGLASTSPQLRAGGSIPDSPTGYEFQWELNAWPPMMMLAVEGLQNYSQNPGDAFDSYAQKLQKQWVQWIEQEFMSSKNDPTHHGQPAMHEKAPYTSSMEVKPGYYGNLRGFGWTVASYLTFLRNLGQQKVLTEFSE